MGIDVGGSADAMDEDEDEAEEEPKDDGGGGGDQEALGPAHREDADEKKDAP